MESNVQRSRFTILVGLLILWIALPSPAEELRLAAKELFRRAVTHNLALDAEGTSLVLDRGVLIEDDGPAAGYSYKPNVEKLSEQTWIKKELLVPNPRAKEAFLLIGSRDPLAARLNGKPLALPTPTKVGNYWRGYSIDPKLLKQGKNEIVLHGKGTLWIAREDEYRLGSTSRTSHPNRSAKSTDAGKTWDYEPLGPDGSIDGEYYVRLFLNRVCSHGSLRLGPIDVGNLKGRSIAPPVEKVGPVRVRLASANASKSLSLRVRTGPSPSTSAEWSGWQTIDASGGTIESPTGRYLEVEVGIASNDAIASPSLEKLEIEASPTRPRDWTRSLEVLTSENPKLVRTSIPFEYEPFELPALDALRKKYHLDKVVQGAKDEFEIMTRLARWSAGLWKKGHLGESYPAWNALEILKPHGDGTPIGGFCQQYNLVFLQACASFGIVGRAVSIGAGDHGSKIRSGHEVVELWSNDYKKWVYVDGNAAWYFVDVKTKEPLSLWELRQRQVRRFHGKTSQAVEVVRLAKTRYTWDGLDGWPAFFELRLVPRSNFLAKVHPLPLNQGMRGWFWTGHYVWDDTAYPASLLYGHRVRKMDNWEWTLNTTHVTLEATPTPGVVRVHLTSVTPNFDMYLATVDGETEKPVESGFLWRLQPGENALVVRSRNSAGRRGSPSRMVVRYR